MHRAAAVLAVTAALLAGCGSSSSGGSSLPTLGTTTAPATTTTPPAATTSTAPVVDPSPWTALPKRDVGPNKGVYTGAVLASSAARSKAEKDGAAAWLRFFAYLTRVGDTGTVDRKELATVASGNPATTIETYAQMLRSKGRRTIGWASLNVTAVKVGPNATLMSGCVDNGTYDVDRVTEKRLEQGSVGWDAEAAARVVDGRLVITSSGLTPRTTRCPVGGQ